MKHGQFQGKSDEALIAQMRKGAVEVSDYLVNKYKGAVRSLADKYYLIGADREDLVQEGMIGLFKAVRDYREDRNTSFYSFAVLCIKREMFTAINKYHSKKNLPLNNYVSLSAELENEHAGQESAPKLLDVLESESASNPEQVALDNEFIDDFEQISKDVFSEKEGRVMELLLQGKSYREIAGELSLSPKSVDNAIQRCKQKLGRIWNVETGPRQKKTGQK